MTARWTLGLKPVSRSRQRWLMAGLKVSPVGYSVAAILYELLFDVNLNFDDVHPSARRATYLDPRARRQVADEQQATTISSPMTIFPPRVVAR